MMRSPTLVAIACTVGSTCTAAYASEPTYRVVARSGEPAAGIVGATLADIVAATINQRGDVAFTADLTGAGAPTNQRMAIFADFGAGAQLMARAGDPAPQTVGANFLSFYIPTLNDSGGVLFSSVLTGPSVVSGNDSGLWKRIGSSFTLVAREGDVIPVGTGFLFPASLFSSGSELRSFVFNDAGETLLSGVVTGSQPDFLLASNSITSLVSSGDAVPGVPGATFVESNFVLQGGLSDTGRTLLVALITGGGSTGSSNSGLWVRHNGQFELLAREGAAAPGGLVPQTFNGFDAVNSDSASFGVSDSGLSLFPGFLGTSTYALFRGSPGSIERIAGNGVTVPDVPNATYSNSGPLQGVINAQGRAAFAYTLVGPPITTANNQGVWSDVSGSFRLMLRKGDLAPAAGGALFQDFENVLLNDVGQVAVSASLSGGGIGTANNQGVWMTDSAGLFQLVVRRGQSFVVAPGLTKTIRYFGFIDEDDLNGTVSAASFSIQNNLPRALNNRGELAMILEFTDGSRAAVVATLAPSLPCPADLTVDGFVDDSDFVLFARQYAAFDCNDPTMTDACSADFTADGFVDDIDFVIFSQAYEQFACP